MLAPSAGPRSGRLRLRASRNAAAALRHKRRGRSSLAAAGVSGGEAALAASAASAASDPSSLVGHAVSAACSSASGAASWKRSCRIASSAAALWIAPVISRFEAATCRGVCLKTDTESCRYSSSIRASGKPSCSASAMMPPVDVPPITSKSSCTRRPVVSSSALSISIVMSPLVPPPSSARTRTPSVAGRGCQPSCSARWVCASPSSLLLPPRSMQRPQPRAVALPMRAQTPGELSAEALPPKPGE
mmetsp:Transcript_18121/g.58380  ORF Transcript_18121/g.58380 Transcript_18121/m.58380 type:complete len:246 (+) Transcript_18121:742-1479(+)